MEEKEYYHYTYEELVKKLGEEKAKEKAEFYKNDFLVKYPKTMCVVNSKLMKTYKPKQS